MEYPWRSRPPNGNLCPVCSHSHVPFCPPPIPQYFRPPPPPPPPDQFFHNLPSQPPPPPPQPSYDPFVDHQGPPTISPYPPPAPAQISYRPWNGNPNFSNDYYGDSKPGLNYDSNGQIGVKRMRLNNVNDSYMGSLSEDERRLKLIRDHGAVSHGLDRKYDGGYRVPGHSFEPSNMMRNSGDHIHGIEGGYHQQINSNTKQSYGEPQAAYQHFDNNKNAELGRSFNNQTESNAVHYHGYGNSVPGADGFNNFKRPSGNHEILAYDDANYQEQSRNFSTESLAFNNQFLQSHATQQHRVEPKSAYYSLSNQSENVCVLQDPQGFKAKPPLPTSPPPPLPVEPPRFHFWESVVSSSASGLGSLFPVTVDSASSVQYPYTMVSETITSVSSRYTSKVNPNSSGYYPKEAAKMA